MGAGRMGYQRGLDGVRALSVIGVLLYHAGFGAFHGGFLGVEVFFVVSGFLITGLLVEEWERHGSVSLGGFWKRRWRRLLPALLAMIVAVCVWAALWGTAEQRIQLRRDVPWAVLYGANWGQIVGEVPYFAPSPPLLRHVWSLAVEEQWYVVWPLVCIGVLWAFRRRGWRASRLAAAIAGAGLAVMVLTAALAGIGEWDAQRQNFVYLSTLTRCSGLLLGAGMAFVWRPWRVGEDRHHAGRVLDAAAVVAVVAIGLAMWRAAVTDQWTYWWWLPLVSIASAVLVAAVVHPWATRARTVFGWEPLVALGKRSYGVYVWSWPISRVVGAYEGSFAKFALAMAITAVVAEASYRFLETPIRSGRWGTWLRAQPPQERLRVRIAAVVGGAVLLGSLGVYYRGQPATYDEAADVNDNVPDFDPAAAGLEENVDSGGGDTIPADTPNSAPTVTVAKKGPLRVAIVGDSTAHALWINAPKGLNRTFKLIDGAVSGCSVYDTGVAVGDQGARYRTLSRCKGWQKRWATTIAKNKAEIALVQIGAWDTLSVDLDGRVIPFGSPEHDARILGGLQLGVDTLLAAGARKVGFDEVPCMRPGIRKASTIEIPERGLDDRVAHLNDLMRQIVAKNPKTTAFITGPTEWCHDETISRTTAYRYDGVHFYKAGARLQFEAISKQLLELGRPPQAASGFAATTVA